MTAEPKYVIAKWLTRLARVVRHHQQLSDFDRGEMIADYTAMLLRDDLPCAAFSIEALHYVSDGCEWWPSYTSLADRLREHWAIQRYRIEARRLPQLEGPTGGKAKFSEEEKAWQRFWQKNELQNWGTGDEVLTDGERADKRRIGLSMVKRYAPAVWEQITGAAIREDEANWHDKPRRKLTDFLYSRPRVW